MKNINKKGFTLVELLSVIVFLHGTLFLDLEHGQLATGHPRDTMRAKREGTGFPIPAQKVLIYAVLISRSSASAGPRKPCRGGPRPGPSRGRCRGWRPG